MPIPLGLTTATLMLDIETEWTLNALLPRLSSYRKCSKLGHSAQATSLLPIAGTTKCSHSSRVSLRGDRAKWVNGRQDRLDKFG
jgi:hypothetical protein